MRITPAMDQRMLLWGFKQPPAVNVKLAVKGPIGGADLSQFQFIQVHFVRLRRAARCAACCLVGRGLAARAQAAAGSCLHAA